MKLPEFERIFIHESAAESELSQRLQSMYPESDIALVSKPPYEKPKGKLSPEEFVQSKKQIYVAPFQGQFFKRCPGAKKGLSCCNYYVLNLGLQCAMDCSYCYLQSFINTPYSLIYSNIDQALLELDELYEDHRDQKVRVGTGEVIDSLSMDPVTLYSKDLIRCFQNKPNWTLEFKTKSDQVDQFLNEEHAGNVVVSWSINPSFICDTEEHGTASLTERLEAAKKCKEKGFQIAFHIDPMIWYPQWKEGYKDLVDQICSRFSPEDMPYISIGALRFQPEQKSFMRERFGMKSWVNRAEMFPSGQGKLRYDQQVREEMFRFLKSEFKQRQAKDKKQWRLFLCMETPETWIASAATNPFRDIELKPLFEPISIHR